MYKYQSDAWQMANLNAFVSILELKLNYVHIYIYTRWRGKKIKFKI